jgi:hypothetical protein
MPGTKYFQTRRIGEGEGRDGGGENNEARRNIRFTYQLSKSDLRLIAGRASPRGISRARDRDGNAQSERRRLRSLETRRRSMNQMLSDATRIVVTRVCTRVYIIRATTYHEMFSDPCVIVPLA